MKPTRTVAVVAFLVIANLALFARVATFEFVNYDDPLYIVDNPHVRTGLTFENIEAAFTQSTVSGWYPLTMLSYMLTVQLFGLTPGPHHVTNLLLHITTTLILFIALRRITKAHWLSAAVAALFALHPQNVESVAWVAARKDVLSALFWWLTVWAYAAYADRPDLKRYMMLCALFTAGLMAKAMLITLPFALLLLDYWPLRRVPDGPEKPKRWLELVAEKIPLLALAGAFSVLQFIVQRSGGAIGGLEEFSMGDRLTSSLAGYASYLLRTLWPHDLAVHYPYFGDTLTWTSVALAVAVLAAITIFVVLLARRHPYLPVGWLWFLGTLVPVIGIVQVGSHATADRYAYIPTVGLFIIIVWGLTDLIAHRTHGKTILAAAAALTLAALATLTDAQLSHWRNTESLWKHTITATENNDRAHYNLGREYARLQRHEEAFAQFNEAVRINPNYADAHNNLGFLLDAKGLTQQALAKYRTALRIDPELTIAHINTGNALQKLGDIPAAIAAYTKALQIDPASVLGHTNLGNALTHAGELDAAIREYSEAIRLDPTYSKAHDGLGTALTTRGNYEQAVAAHAQAILYDPNFAGAHNNLGSALARQGDLEKAISEFNEAIRLDPLLAEAHNNLGSVLANQGHLGQAVKSFVEALRVNPDYPDARQNLQKARSMLQNSQ